MSEYPELDRILSRYFDGSITADELAALEVRLLADDQFAEQVSRWCLLHRQVSELLTETKLHALMDHFVKGSPTLPKDALLQLASKSTRKSNLGRTDVPFDDRQYRVRGFPLRRLLAWGVAAASVFAVAAWALYFRSSPDSIRARSTLVENIIESQDPKQTIDAPPQFVATLTQVEDCVWEAGTPAHYHGQQLIKGDQIALASGMAKVTFHCGAEVVLQGPCDFIVQSQMVGFLKSGRLTADVPRRAFTFAILSSNVDFVDLGTSFGLNIGENGRTALHVFEGEVLCSKTNDDADSRNEIFHVTADNAVEFDTRGSQPADIAMDRVQFSRLIALRRPTGGGHARVIPDQLALWLAADVAVTADDQQRVVSWQDIVYGGNVSAEDAMQADERSRPLIVADAIGGRPAVRFNGSSNYLLTTPLETTDNQTVLFVCQFSPHAFDPDRRWGGQILNYDGPDRLPEDITSDPDLAERTRYLSNTLVPGVLQIGEPLLENQFQPTLLTGQVFSGFVGSATVEAGRVDANPIGANQPVVVAYRYDYDGGKASLWINGRSFGESRAFAPQAVTSRKIIGRHAWKQLYFHGDLAEMLIYNKALSPRELADTTAYLAEKYSIALEPLPVAPPEVTK